MSESIAQQISKKFPIGTIIADRYRLVAPIALGGMGAIYQAEHVMMNRKVAVKLLRPELTDRDESKRRFVREAKLCAQLSHPNCVTVYDFDILDDEIFFLAMEFLKGESLAERITRQGCLPSKQSVEIFCQLLDALGAAHQLGIVHRDIKPSNIMLVQQEDGSELVKLLDFGIAKAPPPTSSSSEDSLSESTITQHGLTVGTPEYISPEQAMGHPADGRADLYSAGVSLFETLTSRLPFLAETPVLMVTAHVTEPAPKPSTVAPRKQIPTALDDVVLRALEKDPVARFPDAASFKQALLHAEPSAELFVAGVRVKRATPLASQAYPLAAAQPVLREKEDSWKLKALPSDLLQTNTAVTSPKKASKSYVILWVVLVAALVALTGYYLLLDKSENTTVANSLPSSKPKPTSSIDKAQLQELFEKQDYASAEKIVSAALAQNPNGGLENLFFGHVSSGLQDTGKALAAYQLAVEADPENCLDPQLQSNLGKLLETKHKDEKSKNIFVRCQDKLLPVLAVLLQSDSKQTRLDANQILTALEKNSVDTLSWFGEELKKTQDCQERLFWIKKIAASKNRRGTSYLKGEEKRAGSSCLLGELKKAQSALLK